MEDLVQSLQGSFHVTKEPNSTACPHPRFSQYKQRRSNSDQESRRKRLLEIQKSNREDYLNLVRKLTDEDWSNEKEEPEDEPTESMDITEVKIKKPGRYYKDQLMLSEWLVEVPQDFQQEWLTVLCPVAKRCLVVASRGQTRAYTKSGYCINQFPSGLPGGHHRKRMNSTILDCLYSEANRTFYVLDLMCWNGHQVYDSETEFRFYWMHEKFQEFEGLKEITKSNPYIFQPLPSFACENSILTGALGGAQFEIDGVLFYHKRSHYTFGSTPLVVWLKPYMVPEILGVGVPSGQMKGMPAGYTNYADHMKQVEEDKKANQILREKRMANSSKKTGSNRNRKHRKKTGNVEMEDEERVEDGVEEMERKCGDGETATDSNGHSVQQS